MVCSKFSKFPHCVNVPAPTIGPTKNPILNAIPIRAIPFCLVLGVDTSVIIAVARLTLPFESPPIILARTKSPKVDAFTHNAYEKATPAVLKSNKGRRPKWSDRPPIMGLATNCKNENKEPSSPPNKTELNWPSGTPIQTPNSFTVKVEFF